jgi:hypothetical protein
VQTTRLCTLGVFSTAIMCSPCAPPSELRNGGVRIRQEALFVARIAPGPRDDPRAVTGTNIVLKCIDHRVERGRINHSLFY